MEDLIKKPEFYKTLDLFSAPVIIGEGEENHLYFNQAFIKQIGYTSKEIPNLEAWFLKAYPSDTYRNEVVESWNRLKKSAKRKGLPYVNMIANIYCADGTYKWFDVYEYSYDKNRLVMFQNVDCLVGQHVVLQDSLKLNNTLLSILSHDTKNPVFHLHTILDDQEVTDLEKKDLISILINLGIQGEHIYNIVDSLWLHISYKSKQFVFKAEKIGLQNLVDTIKLYFERTIHQQLITFTSLIPANTCIFYDVFILEILIRSILTHALKHTPMKGKICVSFQEEQTHGEIIITYKSKGFFNDEMMLENEQSLVKNKVSTKTVLDVGLILIKDLLNAYHGELLIKSGFNEKTSFVIRLPKFNS